MKIFIRGTSCALVLLLIVFMAQAGDNDKAGTTAATFLKLGVGARAAAMGNSAVGFSTDATAIYWNPAALGAVKRTDVVLGYNRWIDKTQHGFVGIAVPGATSTAGVGVVYFNSGKMMRTEASPGGGYVTKGDFTNTDAALIVGWGFRLVGETSIGVAAKAIYEGLAGESAFAFAGDAAIFSRIEMVEFGVVGRNLGSKIKFKDEQFPLPVQILGGVAVRIPLSGVMVSATGGSVSEGKTQFSFGAEYMPIEYVAVRAGYKTGMNDVTGGMKGLSAGVGFNFAGFRLDYAFNTLGDLGPTHHLALGIGLATSAEAK
jgi:hypothetical protein